MMFAVSLNGSRALTSDEVQVRTMPLVGDGLFFCASAKDVQFEGVNLMPRQKMIGEESTPVGSPHPLMVSDLKVAGRLEVDAQWQ